MTATAHVRRLRSRRQTTPENPTRRTPRVQGTTAGKAASRPAARWTLSPAGRPVLVWRTDQRQTHSIDRKRDSHA
jgi:hypothetical protein